MSQFEVVVLANSIKHHQHCVAGKLVSNGQWVRPVSNLQGGELSDAQARSQNPYGMFNAKPLQKVIIIFFQNDFSNFNNLTKSRLC